LVLQVKADRIVVTTLVVWVVWCKLLEHGEQDLQTKMKERKEAELTLRTEMM